MKVKILKTDKDLPTPKYAHEGDAGMDLYSAEELVLRPGEHKLVQTGIRIAVPAGYEMQVRPRSGLAAKHGISVVNAPGTIDSQYRGPVGVILINHGKNDFEIKKGDRIAQIVLNKFETIDFHEVEELDDTQRGEGGFGSTGKR